MPGRPLAPVSWAEDTTPSVGRLLFFLGDLACGYWLKLFLCGVREEGGERGREAGEGHSHLLAFAGAWPVPELS